jgi:uncharacterized protein (UPF0332 family)
MNVEEKQELIKYYFEKADELLVESDFLARGNFWNSVANRLYYACFNAVRAVFINDGIQAHTHSGVKSQFHKSYIQTKIFDVQLGEVLNRLLNQREDADYKIRVRFTKEQIEPCIEEAKRFVEIMKTRLNHG